MSSSPYRRVTVDIENGNGGLLTNIADKLIENWIFKRLEGKLVPDCFRHENDDNRTPPTHKEDIKVGRPFKLLNLFVVKTVNHND